MPKAETDGKSGLISRENLHSLTAVTLRETDISSLSLSGDATSVIAVSAGARHAPLLAGAKRFAALAEEEIAHGRTFIFAPVFLGAGAAFWFSLTWTPDPVFGRTALFIGLTLFIATRHLNRALALVAGAIALFAAGMWLAEAQTARRATVILDASVTLDLRGRVVSREAVAGGGWRYVVDIEATENPKLKRPPSRVALVARGRHAVFAEGREIRGRARLSPPSGPAMPGLSDFAFSSYFQGIGAIGFFYGKPEAAASGPVAPEGVIAAANGFISHLRGAIGERIRSIIPGDAGAFATAMVTDERRAMTRETAEALRLSGLAHIIAISGLNMALAAGIFFVGLRSLFALHQGFAQAFPIKKLAAAGALAGVTAYYLLSGSAVSAQRAWLMMSIMLIAVLLGRPSISMRNVAISALVILILSPSDVMGASFQMSFAATAALVAGYALHRKRKRREVRPSVLPGMAAAHGLWAFFRGIALTSIIGGVSTAIFSIAHFQQLAVWGLPANLAAMPVVSLLVMPAGLLAMLLMPFGLDEWPLRVMGFGLEMVITVAKEVAGWGGESATGMPPTFVFPLVAAGFLLLTLLRTTLRLTGAALILVTAVAGFALPAREKPALLISEGGDLVGLVGKSAIATNRARPPAFIFSQWRRALKLSGHDRPHSTGDAAPPKAGERPARRPLTAAETEEAREAMSGALAQGPPGRFACFGKLWCVARHSGGMRVATVSEAAYIDAACKSADLVITPLRLRRSSCARPEAEPAHFIGGVALARNGSVSITFDETKEDRAFSIETARNGSQRPWTRHRLYDWRDNRFIDEDEAAEMLDFSDSGE